MTTILSLFLSFLRQNRNKICLELGEKAPKNEKNAVKRPPYKEKVAKSPQYNQKTFVLLSRGGGGATAYTLAHCIMNTAIMTPMQSHGFNNHYFLYKK